MRKLRCGFSDLYQRPTIDLALLLVAVLMSAVGCALPGSATTQVVISGQLLDDQGRGQSGKAIEFTLPAEYGMSEIDREHGSAEDFGRRSQRHTAVTDFLGSFSARFAPVDYSTAWWVLPPLGRFPRVPPDPMVLIRVLDSPSTWYQILLKEDDIVYTILTSSASGFVPAKSNIVHRRISGKQRLEERGDVKVWISDLSIRGKAGISQNTIK
jgi:hypothetical protein